MAPFRRSTGVGAERSETVASGSTVPGGEEPTPPARPEDGFGAWAAPHLSALWALAAHEVGAGAADDVVQETLLRAWRRWSTYDAGRGTPRAWLVGILLDRSRRHRARRRPATTPFSVDAGDAGRDAAERLRIEQAVRRLPPRQRQVVVLHYLADLAVADVAAQLEISPGAVKAQLFDARSNLRRLLEED